MRGETIMKKRILVSLLCMLLAASAVFMTGCGGEEKTEQAGGAGDTLVYGSQDYKAINPALYEHG